MPGPAPKSPATRQRRNIKSTAAQLVADPHAEVPELPEPPLEIVRDAEGNVVSRERPEWHPMVLDEWEELHRSPMASQLLPTDWHALLKLVYLTQTFWTTGDAAIRRAVHAELRVARRDFGLTPMARASLHWEIARAEDAGERRAAARAARRPHADAEAELAALEP